MLEVQVIVRDASGNAVEVTEMGVDRLVQLVRARPPDEQLAGDPDHAATVGVWGSAVLSLEAVESAARQVAALRGACVAAVAEEMPGWSSTDRVLDEVSCALVVSRRSAQHTWRTSEALRHQPEVWRALALGEIDQTRAVILADALFEIPRADPEGVIRPKHTVERAMVLEEGLAYARDHTARRLAIFLRRRLASLGCADRPRRRRRALAERGVWIAHDGEGTADLTARLSSEDAERVYASVRAMALADRNGDPRTDDESVREPFDQWMAAAFVDAILGAAGPPCQDANPQGRGARASLRADRCRGHVETAVTVTIPVESLAGLTDEAGLLNGIGVIPAEVARRLAAGDARWRHVLTSRSSGAILDVGTLSYRPPAALARHVRLRDGTCRFPGCEVPSQECDLDHLVPFPNGPTSAENLHALCRRHHGLKHEDGWRVEALGGATLRWTSPQGATALTHPDDTHRSVA